MFHFRISSKYLLLLLIVLLAGCGQTINTGGSVVGSGNVKSESREVSGFSKVALPASGTVTITVTGTETLTIEAEDNILPLLTSDVSNGVLELGTKPNTSISTRIDPRYTLTVKSLDDLKISGSASVTMSALDAEQFRVTISGSGAVTPSGKAADLSVNISGSGSFKGDALEAQKAVIVNTGSGTILVNASDTVEVDNSGSGTVEYLGSPTLTVQNTGSGIVRKH